MPSLGADMEDGTFVEWHVEPGQNVARGQVICVVETQKGAVDVEIWEGGVLAKLLATAGQKIPVGQVMALVATGSEDWKAIPAAVPSPPPPRGEPRPETPARGTTQRPAAAVAASGAVPPSTGRVKVSPAARRRAEEMGMDLAAGKPAGAHGVISIADVELAGAARKPPDRQAAMRDAIAAAMSRSKRE